MNNNLNRNSTIFSITLFIFSLLILQSFSFGIISGALVALSVWPIFEFISKNSFVNQHIKFIKQDVSSNAMIFSIIFAFLFFIPIFYAFFEIFNIYNFGSNYISTNSSSGKLILIIPSFVEYLPMKEKIYELWNENIDLISNPTELINKLNNGKVFSISTYILTGFFTKITTILVMLITFYFMLKNGDSIKQNYKKIFSHWIGEKSVKHIDSGIASLRGTINGVILIGIIEGVLLSIPLVAAGFPSGFVIALTAGIMGVIPLLMPIMIAPCLIYLYLSGDVALAIFGAIDLAFVWFVFENIVKPQVIGKTVKVNTFLILASMIGGMQVFGFIGLFVGPAIISMANGMIKDYLIIDNKQ